MPDLVVYKKLALTGGGATALDGINGAALVGDELAFVTVSDVIYHYILNATSGAAESSPSIIAPDANPGNKRWILQDAVPVATGTGTTVKSVSPTLTGDPLAPTAASTDIAAVPTQIANLTFVHNEDAMISNPKSYAQGVALTAAASGSSGIQVPDNANINPGTGNFALRYNGSIPLWIPGGEANQWLVSKYQNTDNRFGLYVATNGTFGYLHRKTGGTSVTAATTSIPSLVAGSHHDIVAVIVRETASVPGSVSFYIDRVLFETVAIPVGTPANIDNTGVFVILGYSEQRLAGIVNNSFFANFAPTSTEIDSLVNGIPESWKWGSQTPVYTSNFSAGVDTWANGTTDPDLTLTGNIDGIAGVDDVMRIAGSGDGAPLQIIRDIAVFNATKHYTIAFDYYADADTGIGYLGIGYSGYKYNTENNIAVIAGSWQTNQILHVDGINVSHNSARLFGSSSATGPDIATLLAGKNIYIKNYRIVQIGVTGAWESEGIQPVSANSLWLDSSSNKLNATLPAAGVSNTRKIDVGRYVWSTAMTGDTTWTSIIPAGFTLEKIVFNNSTANAATLRLGSTANANDVKAATAIAASGFTTWVIDKTFSLTADQTLYLNDESDGNWNSSSLTSTLFFRRVN